MKRTTHIYQTPEGAIVRQQTALQAFCYDWRHYSLGVAIHNALWLWVHRHDKTVRTYGWR